MKKTTFTITNREVMTKGDLKGYITAMISFSNKPEVEHELLYRVHDPENGEDFTIVSIDYGYNNKEVDNLWNDIETEFKKFYEWYLVKVNRTVNDIIFA